MYLKWSIAASDAAVMIKSSIVTAIVMLSARVGGYVNVVLCICGHVLMSFQICSEAVAEDVTRRVRTLQAEA